MERDLRADLSPGARSGRRLAPAPTLKHGQKPGSKPTQHAADPGRNFAAGPPELTLYVHVPWCVRKCPYCDFNSHAMHDALPERRYIDALLADLDAQLGAGVEARPLRSVFIGGGTPSLCSGAAIRRLLDGVRARCQLAADVEITLEANPGTVDAGHFEDYLRAGVNRLSIGVQSLSAHHLVALGRIHDPRQALAAYTTARQVGYDNVNLDMMFGLPGQTIAQARDDLERLIALQPEHLSYYQLTMEPNTAFAQSPPAVADDDELCDMQDQGIALLAAAGYQRYEVSAYAREHGRCRHNLNYWRFGDYIGIGAGAHGKLTHAAGGQLDGQVERRTCRRHPDAYVANADRLSTRRWLSDQDLILEFALNAFRLVDGVESALFERQTGLSRNRLDVIVAQAQQDELLASEPGWLRPSALGLRFLTDLVARFDIA
jgi:putative oxygen-independent coproporphyrinogen III oxidase